MRRNTHGGAVLLATLLTFAALSAPASAMQVLEAADHAELQAEVSATGVSRVALEGDRIARVIRSPGGFTAEHDPARGDLYLRPLPGGGEAPVTEPEAEPAALFIGTEKGFTYRLVLTPAEGGAAQILIRNPEATAPAGGAGDARVGALVDLIRAVARREPVPGYAIEAGTGGTAGGPEEVIEVWRGPRFTALVLALGADSPGDAAALSARLGRGIAAAWVSAPGAAGGRLAVAVREGAGGVR